jgi:hypothetical protein
MGRNADFELLSEVAGFATDATAVSVAVIRVVNSDLNRALLVKRTVPWPAETVVVGRPATATATVLTGDSDGHTGRNDCNAASRPLTSADISR